MLQKMNRNLEKWMPLITPTSVILGIILTVWLKPFSYLVPWIFGFMTFSGSLSLNFRDLKRALTQPFPIFISMVALHVLMPAMAWAIGHLLFPGDAYLITGMILLLVVPTGIVSFMWVSIYNGNIALTLSVILIDTLLSPFLVPFTMHILVGAQVKMDIFGMMQGLLLMVVLPSLLGMLLNQLTAGKVKETVGPRIAPFSKIGLAVVIAINSAVVAPYFTRIDGRLVLTAFVIVLIVSFGYVLGWLMSKWFKWDRNIMVTMVFNCGMRNNSAGAVLAISYFPPPVAIPVIIGMLFQQLLASIFGQLLCKESAPIKLKPVLDN
ncbi:Predicted Na+-dependent transporter [Paenibacillus sp. yr247]|uniref:bile acid:sodium symporter family protein n=1 Tax=Paenibacillus sp. yr247 TaxID=1761880 RepID=UPI00088F5065|nr:bile acid:sodium symporter family protein [Paenibacillus sp. yr247]SDM82330.1 Predicted Na+-dependent transporter [Paenibacillus sp. yr247]